MGSFWEINLPHLETDPSVQLSLKAVPAVSLSDDEECVNIFPTHSNCVGAKFTHRTKSLENDCALLNIDDEVILIWEG